MTDAKSQDDGRTVFEFDQSDDAEQADIRISETWTNEYNDKRAALTGDTYEAKDTIKFDWEITHHNWNPRAERWEVDADELSLERLRDELEAEGFTVDFSTKAERRGDGPLFDLHDYVEEGDDITVVYQQKNGEGLNDKAGEVVSVTHNSGWEDKPEIDFRRHGDNHFMYVQYDDYDKVSLYTGGSTNPFVGAVEKVVVHTDEDRGTETEQAEPDASETETLPWETGDC